MKNLRLVAMLLAVALLAGMNQPAKALLAGPPPAAAVSTTGVGAGVYVVGGFIAVVTVLCVWDFVQKVNGLKAWDGSMPLKATRHKRAR